MSTVRFLNEFARRAPGSGASHARNLAGEAVLRDVRPALAEADARPWILNTSLRDARAPIAAFGCTAQGVGAERRSTPGYPKFKNDLGVPEIRIAAREFECIGASPPHDHPHVHIDMGSQDAILCPYCGTRYRRDDSLTRAQADPEDSLFTEPGTPLDAAAPTLAAAPPSSSRPDVSIVRGPGRRDRRAALAVFAGKTMMFGRQGGEDVVTVAGKRGYLKEAEIKRPVLTNLDDPTIKGEGQLIDLVSRTRTSLSKDDATRDVRAWTPEKPF